MTVRVIGFKTKYRNTPNGTVPQDWVEIAPSGDAFQSVRTWHRIDHIRPPDEGDVDDRTRDSDHFAALKGRWQVVGPAYEAWKQGQEIPDEGTPLEAWSGVTPELCGHLKRNFGIRTVEELAALSPDHAVKLPHPNARALPDVASKWLGGQDSTARAEKERETEARMKAMEELIAELSEKNAALEADKPKRGPGRPKKESEAA